MKKRKKKSRIPSKKPRKVTPRQQRRMELELLQLQALASAGVELIETWSLSGNLKGKEISTLSAMGAALFASYMSSKSGIAAKRAAIAMALRAAYLYGRYRGEFPTKIEAVASEE